MKGVDVLYLQHVDEVVVEALFLRDKFLAFLNRLIMEYFVSTSYLEE